MKEYNLNDRHIIQFDAQQDLALYTEDLHVWYGQNEAIKGGKGNIEFLIHLGKDIANPGQDLWKGNPSDVVQRAVNGL